MFFHFLIELCFVAVEGKEIRSGDIEDVPTKEKSKFPQDFFPEVRIFIIYYLEAVRLVFIGYKIETHLIFKKVFCNIEGKILPLNGSTHLHILLGRLRFYKK